MRHRQTDLVHHTLLEEGKSAFKAQQFALSQKLFTDALMAGADEDVCHLHLARIYNLSSEWSLALQHWQWLSARAPEAVEPKLQIGRALFRLKRRDEARSAFEAVLALQRDHPEALRRLKELQDPAVQVTLPSQGEASAAAPAGTAASTEEVRGSLADKIGQPSPAVEPDSDPPDRIGRCGDRGDGGQSDSGGCAGGVSSPGLRPCGSIVPAGVGRGGR